ncbi:MAG: hypothetical protein FWC66_08470 [Oscillospiraceae bacterium]|nr:hypothetical protein [Oscillospiraceae bacterium]
MKTYLVVKRVNLQVGSKTYRKDAIITSEMVGHEKIRSYLARGYIRELGDTPFAVQTEESNLPAYLVAEAYLAPEEINALKRADLIKYAEHIGVEFKRDIKAKDLQSLVVEFIEEAVVGEEPDDDASDTNDSADNLSDDDENGEENT